MCLHGPARPTLRGVRASYAAPPEIRAAPATSNWGRPPLLRRLVSEAPANVRGRDGISALRGPPKPPGPALLHQTAPTHSLIDHREPQPRLAIYYPRFHARRARRYVCYMKCLFSFQFRRSGPILIPIPAIRSEIPSQTTTLSAQQPYLVDFQFQFRRFRQPRVTDVIPRRALRRGPGLCRRYTVRARSF